MWRKGLGVEGSETEGMMYERRIKVFFKKYK